MSKRKAGAQFTVIRAQDERKVEEAVNRLLQGGSKVLDLKLAIDPVITPGYRGEVVVAILHCPNYFEATDVFGSPKPVPEAEVEDATSEGTDEDLEEEPEVEGLPEAGDDDEEEDDLDDAEEPSRT